MSEETSPEEVVIRARRLRDDLNMTTLGWQMPSDRLIEDFAGGEHRLGAREHELTDIDRGGARGTARRAFSLYAPDAETRGDEPFALLIEPEGPGNWRLLVTDASRGHR